MLVAPIATIIVYIDIIKFTIMMLVLRLIEDWYRSNSVFFELFAHTKLYLIQSISTLFARTGILGNFPIFAINFPQVCQCALPEFSIRFMFVFDSCQ